MHALDSMPVHCVTHLRITIYCTSITLMQRALLGLNIIIKLKARHTRTGQIDDDVTTDHLCLTSIKTQ